MFSVQIKFSGHDFTFAKFLKKIILVRVWEPRAYDRVRKMDTYKVK